jgi:hypothetical protein
VGQAEWQKSCEALVTGPHESGNEIDERIVQAEAALEEVMAERNRLWDELHQRTAREHELEYYKTMTEQMSGSLSWRLTAPLRTFKWFVAHIPEALLRLRRLLARRPGRAQ